MQVPDRWLWMLLEWMKEEDYETVIEEIRDMLAIDWEDV